MHRVRTRRALRGDLFGTMKPLALGFGLPLPLPLLLLLLLLLFFFPTPNSAHYINDTFLGDD